MHIAMNSSSWLLILHVYCMCTHTLTHTHTHTHTHTQAWDDASSPCYDQRIPALGGHLIIYMPVLGLQEQQMNPAYANHMGEGRRGRGGGGLRAFPPPLPSKKLKNKTNRLDVWQLADYPTLAFRIAVN